MLQKCSLIKVAAVFFREPTSQHYLKEISKKAGLAHTSTKKYLLELKKMLIITETAEKRGKRNFPIYKASLESNNYKNAKKLFNIHSLSAITQFLKDRLAPKSMTLFGSYARGEDIEESDIDIFIECKKEAVDLSNFEKELKRKIQLHFNPNFKDYPEELKNNIINGIVLSGYLEAL